MHQMVEGVDKTTKPIEAKLVSGPMLGYVELRSALIWMEVQPNVKNVRVDYWPIGILRNKKSIYYTGELGKRYNPIKLEIGDLMMNVTYQYEIFLDGQKVSLPYLTLFTTKNLWEWRQPAPDFSFVLGSCTYFNDSLYDRPSKPGEGPYGKNTAILKTMAQEKVAFNLWTGDNNYLREADYNSPFGIEYRYSHDRAVPDLQEVLAKRPNFATWDDHDFGPNDANASYQFKDITKETFNKYWGNHGTNNPNKDGIYSSFTYVDCEFFLMDDRYNRAPKPWKDSINNLPNPEKTYWGKNQMLWIKQSLLTSKAVFKFIVNGNQVLNMANKRDECMYQYSAEWLEIINFIKEYKITGVIFISGDRHFTEMLSLDKNVVGYPLYDYTSSPITSGPYKDIATSKTEGNNPQRVAGSLLGENNYGRMTVSGERFNRKLKIETINAAGKPVWEWSVTEKELSFPKQ